MRYCPFCNFRILSSGDACPNCHKTLPDDTVSGVSWGTSQGQQQESGGPGDPVTFPSYDFGEDDEEEEDADDIGPSDIQRERSRRERKLRRHIAVTRVKMAAFLILAILVLASEGIITIPEPLGSAIQPAVDLTGEGVDLVKGLWEDMNAQYYKVPKKVEYVLTRTFTITTDGGNDTDFMVRLAEPHDVKSFYGETIQDMLNFSYEIKQGSADLNFENDSDGNKWYIFSGNVPAGEVTKITLRYHVRGFVFEWDDIKSSNSGTVNDIPQSLKKKYNREEAIRDSSEPNGYRDLIQPDEVRDLAEQVTEGKNTVYGQLKAIYKYIIDNIGYLTVRGKVKACDVTLDEKRGDCDDMSVLFASMTRSIGIPSWLTFGFLTDDQNFIAWGGHAWISAYIPVKNGNGGIDDRIVNIDLANKMFLWHSPTRLIEWDSTGDSDDLSNFYLYTNVRPDYIKDEFHTTDTPNIEGYKYIKVED